MKVEAIDSIRFRSNSVQFGQNDKSDKKYLSVGTDSIRNAAAVPVLVLMTLNPSLLEAKTTELRIPENMRNKTEIVVDEPEKIVSSSTYIIEPDALAPQQKPQSPYDWGRFQLWQTIQYVAPAKAGGYDASLVYATNKGDEPKDIKYVYIVRKDKPGYSKPDPHPPEVHQLVYHNLGDKSKDFCGVITEESVVNDDGYLNGYIRKEIRIDNETANRIIDLVSGDTGWNNKTSIVFKETNSPEIMMPSKY